LLYYSGRPRKDDNMETRGIIVALALLAPAQKLADEQEYRKRMHDIDHSFVAIQEDRRMSRPSEIEKEAAKLEDLFEEVEEFWKGRGEEEAAGFARMAKEGAGEAVKAARKKEPKSLEAAIQSISASCEGCHKEPLDKHRFPKDGSSPPRELEELQNRSPVAHGAGGRELRIEVAVGELRAPVAVRAE
jgi:hypothetical protein